MNRSKAKDGSSPLKKGSAAKAKLHVSDPSVGRPLDLAKVVFVIKQCSKDWTQDKDFKIFVVQKVVELFDDSKAEAIDKCFDIAVDYGFIVAKQKRYEVRDRNELDLSHDWFCFDCDILVDRKDRQFLECDHCFRVFHEKCAEYDLSGQDFRCSYCRKVDESTSYGVLDQNRANVLIRYLLDFIETKMKNDFKKFRLNLEKYQSILVFKTMDLYEIRDKAEQNRYKNVSEFEVDFFVFVHILKTTFLEFHEMDISYEELKIYLRKELKELRICTDCYQRLNDKVLQETNKEWFLLPCNPPHEAVFTKVKGFSPWPSKLIYRHKDGKRAQVRFFDNGLRRMDVKLSDISPIDDQNILKLVNKNPKMHKWMQLLKRYLKLQSESEVMNETIGLEASGQLFEADSQKSNRKKSRKKKSETTTSSASKSKSIPVLPNSSAESDSHIETMTQKVPLLVSTEPPTLISMAEIGNELKDKRRSVRISTQIRNTEPIEQIVSKAQTPVQTLSRAQIPVQTLSRAQTPVQTSSRAQTPVQTSSRTQTPIKTKSRHNLTKDFESEPMEVDSSSETEAQNNFDLNSNVLKEKCESTMEEIPEPLINELPEPLVQQQSVPSIQPIPEPTINELTESQNTYTCIQSHDISMNSHLNYESINERSVNTNTNTSHSNNSSQPLPSTSHSNEMNANNSQTNDLTANQSQRIPNQTNQSIGEEFNRLSKLFDDKYNELMALKGDSISKFEMQEKIVILNHYHNQQVRELDNQLTQTRQQLELSKHELKETKSKNWCAVCQQLAQFYCCLRYYCSKSCQSKDWANGHYNQCLCLPQNDSTFK